MVYILFITSEALNLIGLTILLSDTSNLKASRGVNEIKNEKTWKWNNIIISGYSWIAPLFLQCTIILEIFQELWNTLINDKLSYHIYLLGINKFEIFHNAFIFFNLIDIVKKLKDEFLPHCDLRVLQQMSHLSYVIVINSHSDLLLTKIEKSNFSYFKILSIHLW